MADNKLRCALVYRIESGGKVNAVLLAKYDHAGQYETHGGADENTLYGGRDKSYADAVAGVIGNDPPGGLSDGGTLGGFKVVQSDQHQVVYGADKDALCKSLCSFFDAVPQFLAPLYYEPSVGGARAGEASGFAASFLMILLVDFFLSFFSFVHVSLCRLCCYHRNAVSIQGCHSNAARIVQGILCEARVCCQVGCRRFPH